MSNSIRTQSGVPRATGAAASTAVQRRIELRTPSEFAERAKTALGGKVGVATAGYSAPPMDTPYELNTSRFLKSFLDSMKGAAGFVTSPTASAGSVDALTTVAAHKDGAPLAYVTAQSHLEYIQPETFPPGVDLTRFNDTPVHYFADAADYSRATAEASEALLVTGGRDTTVSDFMHAIEKGNPVVLVSDAAVVTRDESGKVQAFDAKGRIDNASHFLEGVIRSLARGETAAELPAVGFNKDWVQRFRSALMSNVLLVDGATPTEAGERAAAFVSSARAKAPPAAPALASGALRSLTGESHSSAPVPQRPVFEE